MRTKLRQIPRFILIGIASIAGAAVAHAAGDPASSVAASAQAPAERFREPPDYLALKSALAFLDALNSDDVKKPLAGQKAFGEFLQSNKVPAELQPTLVAAYQVIMKAPAGDPDRGEISHILPTVVYFVQDKHRLDVEDTKKFNGVSESELYNNPSRVVIAKRVVMSDPLYSAHTLVHEMQHIYDMYVARHTSSESTEMRGAKAGVLFLRLLKKMRPEKYAELRDSLDWNIRYTLHDADICGEHLEHGIDAFVRDISMGRCYHDVGKALARFSLVTELDPVIGVPVEVANLRQQAESDQETMKELADRRKKLAAQLDKTQSLTTEREFEKADEDMQMALSRFIELDRKLTQMQLTLYRLQRDLAWLRKKSGPEAQIDAFLQVDKDYLTP